MSTAIRKAKSMMAMLLAMLVAFAFMPAFQGEQAFAAKGDRWVPLNYDGTQELNESYMLFTEEKDYYLYSSNSGSWELSEVEELSEEFDGEVITEDSFVPGTDAITFEKAGNGYFIHNPGLEKYVYVDGDEFGLGDKAEAPEFIIDKGTSGSLVLSCTTDEGKKYLCIQDDGWECILSLTDSKDEASEFVLYHPEPKAAADGYVLMNIPYAEFYAAEVANAQFDTVTGATKFRNNGVCKGSYHVSADANKIEGSIYPVHVADLEAFKEAAAAKGATEITADTKVEYEMVVKGAKQTTTLSGQDALFEAPTYSYYVLEGEPANESFKELTIGEDGAFSFGKTNAKTLDGPGTTTFKSNDSHVDYAIALSEEIGKSISVSGVTITADGQTYAMTHIANIWRGKELGWNASSEYFKALSGKTISNITFYTPEGNYSYNPDIQLPGFVEITSSFKDDKTLKIEGIPADAKNVAVSAYTNRKDKSTYVAENAVVTNGEATLTAEPKDKTEYTIVVAADNYKFSKTTATFTAKQAESETPSKEQAKPSPAKVTAPAKVAGIKAKAGKKKATVSWKKVNGATGYEVYRAVKKKGKFTKVADVKTVKFVNKKLKKNKKYVYKVRAYKVSDGQKVYGKYSKVTKKVKVK